MISIQVKDRNLCRKLTISDCYLRASINIETHICSNVCYIYNMNYIFNEKTLPIAGKNPIRYGAYQYYQWKYKQKLEQEAKEESNLKALLKRIEQEQQKQCQLKNYQRSRHSGTFYDYNILWKNTVEQRIASWKTQKQSKSLARDQASMQPSVIHKSAYLGLKTKHKGPIDGWYQHFNKYLKTKSQLKVPQNEQHLFEPQLNKKSKKMTQKLTEKVEDRLINYGQMIKHKIKQEELQKHNDKCSDLQSFSGNSLSQTELFERLYKQGEQVNKRKRADQLKTQCTFEPKLNRISSNLQDKIMQNRKPLYHIKNQITQSNILTSSSIKQGKKKDFQSFMERNQALIDQKKNMKTIHETEKAEKENLQRSKCTFAPEINRHSLMIIKNAKRENQEMKRQIVNDSSISPRQTVEYSCLVEPEISKLTVNKQSVYEDSLSEYYILENAKESVKTKRLIFDAKNCRNSLEKSEIKTEVTRNIMQRGKDDTESGNSARIISRELEFKDSAVDDSSAGKEREWQKQMQKIEDHIEEMMSRAVSYN